MELLETRATKTAVPQFHVPEVFGRIVFK